MKASAPRPFIAPLSALTASVAFLFAGCSTIRSVDWDSRVGTFTYEQAVGEFGPPDSQRGLGDGKTVAVWTNHHSGASSFSVGGGSYGGNTAVGVGHTAGSGRPDRVLRLTFDSHGRLAAWSKNY